MTEISAVIPTRSTLREKWAWYLYDFGNSAYAAVVLLAVYSAYFEGTVVNRGPAGEGTRLWGVSVSIAMLVAAVLVPFLGTIADYAGFKKPFLLASTALSVIFTGMLFFVQPGMIFFGMAFFILAEIGYRGGQVFYNAMLPDIAEPEEMARVSGNGWAIGSLGGIVCLLIVLALIQTAAPEARALMVRISFIITAVFYAISCLPVFLWLKERNPGQPLPEGENYLSLAIKRLGETFRTVRSYKEFIKFIIAFLIYNDGIMMALNFAAIFGAIMFGMQQQELIIFMIIVQVTSVVGAYLFGIVAEKRDAKAALYVSIVLMLGAVVWIYLSDSIQTFYYVGALAGFALTGVQSVSRTLVGLMAPEEKSTEFYSFFAIAGKTSSFIGPAVYGYVAFWVARAAEASGTANLAAEQLGQRWAMLSIGVFLLVGMAVLFTVREKRVKKSTALKQSAELAK